MVVLAFGVGRVGCSGGSGGVLVNRWVLGVGTVDS
ncbi:hypothetical protein A2U01_0109878 [Trifolium medium]|uniref:Uncharacterized protein n=1 Tax=Trifolium medium TaxID=97028 RepID=A0A392VNN0_9FABA|nr:hypothetical protein [Trifolium medium]